MTILFAASFALLGAFRFAETRLFRFAALVKTADPRHSHLRRLPAILTCITGTKTKNGPLVLVNYCISDSRLNGMEEVVGSIPTRSTKSLFRQRSYFRNYSDAIRRDATLER